MKQSTFLEIIAFLFVILFLYTGTSKLMDYTVFKEQIATSPLLAPFSRWIAWLLPLAEWAVAILLFFPPWRLKGLYASLGLMLLFIGYILYILSFNERLPCSCGGVLEIMSWKAHLVFNAFFTGLALAGIHLQRHLFRDMRV